jgi:hypothetical protein
VADMVVPPAEVTSRLRKPVDATVVALTRCRVRREWTAVRAQDLVSDCSVEG